MVALGTVRVSLLKFENRACVLSDILYARSICDVAGRDLQTPDSTRVRRGGAGRTPSIGIRAGYTQSGDGGCFPSNSNLAITTCRHMRAMVRFSLDLINQVLHCVVALIGEGWLRTARSYAVPSVGRVEGCVPLYPFENCAAVSRWCFSLQARGVTLTSAKVNFLHSRSIEAPDSVKKSVPNMPAASVGR